MTPRFHALYDSIEDVAANPQPSFMVLKYTAFETTLLVLIPLCFKTLFQLLYLKYIIYSLDNYNTLYTCILQEAEPGTTLGKIGESIKKVISKKGNI